LVITAAALIAVLTAVKPDGAHQAGRLERRRRMRRSLTRAFCSVTSRHMEPLYWPGNMPLVELSERELKYLAKMNAQNIFVIKQITKKKNTVFPDLSIAEGIQAKFAAMLPDGVPDPFPQAAAEHSAQTDLRRARSGKGEKKR
jgi:hypothetical protein